MGPVLLEQYFGTWKPTRWNWKDHLENDKEGDLMISFICPIRFGHFKTKAIKFPQDTVLITPCPILLASYLGQCRMSDVKWH